MIRVLPLFALAACAVDGASTPSPVAVDQAPPPLSFDVIEGQGTPGEPLVFAFDGSDPADQVFFVRGRAGGTTCPGVLGGSCLSLRDPVVMGSAPGPSGTFDLVVPDAAPPGARAVFQLAVPAGGASYVSPARTITLSDRVALFGVWEVLGLGAVEIDHQVIRAPTGDFEVVRYDNDAQVGIVKNDPAYGPGPGLYGRWDWTFSGGDAYFCETRSDAPTPMDAFLTPRADDTDLFGGCNSGPWVPLTPIDPVHAGSYVDEWGTTHSIGATDWVDDFGSFAISRYSNLDEVIIAQNDASNPFFPGDWSRFDFTTFGGALYYCQTAFDAPSEWAARQTPAADPSNPPAGGCGGFPWTNLTP